MAIRQSSKDISPYVDALEQEIKLISKAVGKKRVLTQLHFGGGTPNFLNDIQLEQLIGTITDQFSIDRAAEFAIEVDPRIFTDGTEQLLSKLGFNRYSLGIQDFDKQVQQAINRVQPFQLVRKVNEAFRRTNPKGINFDLIYGLPHQNLASFARTLDLVVELKPDRVAVYNFAYVPQIKPHQSRLPVNKFPSLEEKFELYLLAIEKLTHAGYRHIGMDHFALEQDSLSKAQAAGNLYRSFQGYAVKRSTHLIGCGISAISKVGNVFAQNVRSLSQYTKYLSRQELPIEKGLVVDQDDQLREWIIQTLMCNFELKFSEFEAQAGNTIDVLFPNEMVHLQDAVQLDLLTIDQDAIRLTENGRHFSRNIAVVFDRHRKHDQWNTFSKAV
ncbi:oxygen-independent coproporphyrinogen III oxidase-like [Ylistrum balloti]|uniref:oxygen-independent coproporphyrinogen III oxidase-like n=1 Tax=Ylistrum balloti TaxID=509963 RepID=UPI002905D3A6|nr:oxygen-independent coproporphyrinogen III oxidase-like [Ylistrum balloti]